jgi:hypothetical protein
MDPGVLWGRAVLLATVTVFLGAVGHVTADGLLPGPAAMLILYVVALVGAAAFLARPATALRLVALLVGGQTLVHLVLSGAAGHAGEPVRTAAPVRTGGLALPTVDGHRVGSLQDAWDSGSTTATGSPSLPIGHLIEHLTGHAPMMLAHTLVAVAVGLWLAVGERALWTLLRLAVRVLVPVVRPLPAVRPLSMPAHAPALPALSIVLTRALARRGPPLVAL